MNRRKLLQSSVTLGFASALKMFAGDGQAEGQGSKTNSPMDKSKRLVPPAKGSIPVAFPISNGAVLIDFCGPWEVFRAVDIPDRNGSAFQLYTVADSLKPITAGGGMKIVPDYTFANAPAPKVIVIPAQNGASDAMLQWIRNSTKTTDLTMSVCTGAFVLAATGLLSGKPAATHHQAYADFEGQFPDVHLKRGARFVEDGNLACSGGLSSGIDLAVRVVERYFGHEAAEWATYTLEYQGRGWTNPDSNETYKKMPTSSASGHPLCPVCAMYAGRELTSAYQGKTYYFCSSDHKRLFDATPEKFLGAI